MTQSSSVKSVAVTGATGFVGRAVVAELLRRGHSVRALVRDRAEAARTYRSDSGVELVEIDLLDSSSVAKALKRGGAGGAVDACIHLVGIIREGPGGQTFHRMHTLATQSVVDACVAAGVRRYVHMSALGAGVGADTQPGGLAVLNGVIGQGVAQYQRTKWAAEQVVRRAGLPSRTPQGGPADATGPASGRAAMTGLDWTIFRPALILGKDSEFVEMVRQIGAGHMQPFWFLPYFTRPVSDNSVPMGPTHFEAAQLQPIAVDDVAAAFAEALTRPESIGEIYNLVGPESFDWREVMLSLRDTVSGADHGKPVYGVPAPLGVIGATVARAVGLGSALAFDAGQAIMSTYDQTGELAKVREHLGLVPRDFDAILAECAGAAH